ncbi:MAG TPA: SURF1 family protein [Euzebyales bacterium]
MYRFLLRPRWIAGHLLVIVTVVAFVNLGFWQLRRLEERRATNDLIAARVAASPQPLDDAVAAASGDIDALEFRRVELSGTFDDGQLLTAPRAIPGGPGQQVLAVFQTDDGPDVLVDRGWVPFDRDRVDAPPAPTGPVMVRGVIRAPEPGPLGSADQIAQIAPPRIADRLGLTLAPYYVQLRRQDPPASDALRPTPLPERTEGNHLSYAVQWFSFAVIAVVGYPLLIRRTARTRGRDGEGRPSASGHPDVSVSSAAGR